MVQEPFNIRLGTDLSELVTLRSDRTMTTLDPKYWTHGEAFWLHCTEGDETVYIIGARLFYVEDLKSDLEGLELFYENPSGPDICRVSVDLSYIKGKLSCDSGLWVNPKFRGNKFSAHAVWECHAHAMERWDPDWYFGLTENAIVEAGVTASQDYEFALPLVTWERNPYGIDFAMHACWADRSYVQQGQIEHHSLST